MKKITFHCQTITPMFLSGADGTTPELRPPSIKGAMRFWWRAMNGHLDLKTLKEREGEIFGNGGTNATQSLFSISVNAQNMQTGIREFVPHKPFMKQMAFIEKQLFTVKLLFKTDKYVQEISNLFLLVSFLGGLGKRSRRGMGSFRVKDIVGQNMDSLEKNKIFSLQNIKNVMTNINPFLDYELTDKIRLRGRTIEQYPYIEVIECIETEKNTADLLFSISNNTHYISEKHKEKAPYVMGNARGFRFSSPVVTRVQKHEANHLVFTKLGTFPPPKFRNYVDLRIQDEFIESIKSANTSNRREKNTKTQNVVNEQKDESFRQKEKNLKEEILTDDKFDWFDYITDLEVDIRLSKLVLTDFKGYRGEHSFEFDKELTLIIGDNGYGKTSLLEAAAISLDYFANKLFGKQLEYEKVQNTDIHESSVQKIAYIDCLFNLNMIFSVDGNIDYANFSEIEKLDADTINQRTFYKKTVQVKTVLQLKPEKPIEPNFEIIEDKYDWLSKIKEFYKKDEKYPFILFGNQIENKQLEIKPFEVLYVYQNALSLKRYNFNEIKGWIKEKYLQKSINNEIWGFYEKILKIKLEEALNNQNEEVKYSVDIMIEQQLFKFSKGVIKNKKSESIQVEYSELSAGEKNIICLVSDIITRIYFASQKTEGLHTQDEFDTYLREAKAIVLIDELDLHLHPKWQREILPKLRKMFPSVQFVITTHSPFVVQNLENDYLIHLARGTKGQNRSYIGWTIDEIITDIELFDAPDKTTIVVNEIQKFYEAIDEFNLENAEKKYNNLIDKLKPDSNLRKILSLEINLLRNDKN